MGSQVGGGGGLLALLTDTGTAQTVIPYIEDVHDPWLQAIAIEIDSAAAGANPYISLELYDPAQDIENFETRRTTLLAAIDAWAPLTDFDTMIDTAVAAVDDVIVPSAVVNAQVETFENKASMTLARAIGRLGSAMAEINATNSLAFALAYSILERGYALDVADFRARLNLQIARDRFTFVMQAVDLIKQLKMQEVQFDREALTASMDTGRLSMTMSKDYINDQIMKDSQSALWKLGLYQYGGNMMAALSGAAVVPKTPSILSSSLSGFMTGGSAGASLGMAAGPEGAAIGFLLGGLIGAVGSGAEAYSYIN